MRTVPGASRELDPEDLRPSRDRVAQDSPADRDEDLPLPRRWRPRKLVPATPGAVEGFIDRT
jgi:hypothetical protein